MFVALDRFITSLLAMGLSHIHGTKLIFTNLKSNLFYFLKHIHSSHIVLCISLLMMIAVDQSNSNKRQNI